MAGAVVAIQGGPKTGRLAGQAYDQAFTRSYEVCYTKIFAFVYSRTGNVDLARDLVSEVFEKAYVKGGTVRDKNAYSAWLFVIARNVMAAYYRGRKRELTGHEKVKDDLRFAEPGQDPEQSALLGDQITRLMEQVRTLPPRDQELLSLKYDAELTHAEIGQITGITPLNVRVSIFRAVKRLRAKMERAEAHAKNKSGRRLDLVPGATQLPLA